MLTYELRGRDNLPHGCLGQAPADPRYEIETTKGDWNTRLDLRQAERSERGALVPFSSIVSGKEGVSNVTTNSNRDMSYPFVW